VEPAWISLNLVLVVHNQQLAEHGGSEGVRDMNALQSALARPKNLAAYGNPAPSLYDLAAAYAAGIARNHPFVDGNKRTALVVSLTFLEIDGIEVDANEEDIAVMFERLAAGKLKEQQLAVWLETIAIGRKQRPRRSR
jgi:death-on-curing protein